MTMSPAAIHLLLDPPAPGAWNMAVDEVLLDEVAAGGERCFWRFYRWSEPTISLGYFQQYDERPGHSASHECQAVRRLTGGGAILHDAELTYSFVLPGSHRLAARREELYDAVHTALVAALGHLGIAARLWPKPEEGQRKDEPFLCFQRRAAGDVVLGEWKIAGSAQRRRRGAVLQHGSLLLRRSPSAPELPGLEEITGKPFATEASIEALCGHWLDELAARLPCRWIPCQLDDDERAVAARLAEQAYGGSPWTEHRQRPETARETL